MNKAGTNKYSHTHIHTQRKLQTKNQMKIKARQCSTGTVLRTLKFSSFFVCTKIRQRTKWCYFNKWTDLNRKKNHSNNYWFLHQYRSNSNNNHNNKNYLNKRKVQWAHSNAIHVQITIFHDEYKLNGWPMERINCNFKNEIDPLRNSMRTRAHNLIACWVGGQQKTILNISRIYNFSLSLSTSLSLTGWFNGFS